MSPTDSTNSNENEYSKEKENQVSELAIYAESIVRVSFAGLGGAIIGLGQKQSTEKMRVLTGSALTAAARRNRSPMKSKLNMPWTMALSCMAFCAVVETTRLTSPSSIILKLSPDSLGRMEPFGTSEAARLAAITISDFTIGGACAGIAGSFRKTSQTQIPIAALRGSAGRFFGVFPGIALGMIAGSLQAAADYIINYLEMVAALERKKSSKPQLSGEKDQ